MISNVTFSLDLTYTNPVTGALQPRGIVRDLTDYNGIGLSPVIFELKALGRIAFNGDVIVEKDNIVDPLIDLQNWDFSEGVPTYTFDLPLDLNGNVANGIYQFLYQLRVNTPFGIQVLGSFAVTDTQFESDGSLWAADFLEIGNTISLDPDEQTVAITAIQLDNPDGVIYTVTPNILDPGILASFSFDITNTQVNATYVYSGCTQTTADVSFTYDCEVGDSGSWSVANTTTLASNEVISALNCTVSYPSWTALTPTFNPQVVLTSLPYPSAPNTETPLATGTYTVSLTEQILQTQTDGLILQYSISTIQEFVVSCAGSLCGLTPCIESLRVAHANELQRNRISKYQVFVDNVLLYYAEAQNYRACGDTANYKATIDLIKTNLDASGCECACCDDNVYYWVSNNSGVSVIDSLVQSFQFRLFDGVPGDTEDVTQGVQVGALWQDFNTGILYRCTVNTEGAAVWEEYYAPGVIPDAIDVPADNTGHNFLTSANVQFQLDQVDALAIFDGFNGILKDGNNLGLGGILTETTVIDCQNVLQLEGGGLVMDVTAKPGVAARLIVEDPATNTVSSNLYIQRTRPDGDPGANGIGSSIWFMANDAIGGNPVKTSTVSSTWVDATIGNSDFRVSTKLGGAENVGLTLNPNGSLTLNEYNGTTFEDPAPAYLLGVDASGNVVQASASNAVVYVGSTKLSGGAISIDEYANTTGATISISNTGVGVYTITASSGVFATNTVAFIQLKGTAGVGFATTAVATASTITIRTFNVTGVADDAVISAGSYIKIESYP